MADRSRGSAVRPAPSGAVRRRAALASAVWVLGGCYAYTPLVSIPAPGTRIALEINDRGRVGLEQHIGPEIAVVEGVLTAASDSELVVNVVETRGLYGSRSRWSGESVVLRPEYVRALRERRYSGPRTIVLAASVAGGFVAFIATRSLLGGGREDNGLPPDSGGGSSIRVF